MIPGTELVCRALAPGDPPHHPQAVLVVVVGAQHDLQDDRDRRDHQGHHERAPEGIDRDARRVPVVRQEQGQGVDEEDRQETQRQRERQPQRRDQRAAGSR